MKLQRHDALDAWAESYRTRQATAGPFLVRLHLRGNAPLCAQNLVHLDNLLARAVVNEATEGKGLPDRPEPYYLPVPLMTLWRDDDGLPLHAASCFWPSPSWGTTAAGGDVAAVYDDVYRHKRMPDARYSVGDSRDKKVRISGARGRYMERRMPLRVTVCDVWEALAWGEAGETLRLLSEQIAFVGKARGMGLGEVAQWQISPVPADMPSIILPQDTLLRAQGEGVVLSRPVPVGAFAALGLPQPNEGPQRIGWTMPQWKPSLFADGWPAGTGLNRSA